MWNSKAAHQLQLREAVGLHGGEGVGRALRRRFVRARGQLHLDGAPHDAHVVHRQRRPRFLQVDEGRDCLSNMYAETGLPL